MDIQKHLIKEFKPTIFDVPTIVDKICQELSVNNLLQKYEPALNNQFGSPNTMITNEFKSDSPFVNQNFCPPQPLSPSAFITEPLEPVIVNNRRKLEEKVDIESLLNPIEKMTDEQLQKFFTAVDSLTKERLAKRNSDSVRSTSQVLSRLVRNVDAEKSPSSEKVERMKTKSYSTFEQFVPANPSVDISPQESKLSSKLSLTRRARESTSAVATTSVVSSHFPILFLLFLPYLNICLNSISAFKLMYSISLFCYN